MLDRTAKPKVNTTAEVAPDPSQVRELVEAYYQDVYRYAFRLAGSHADAEDLAQQAFLIAHRKHHQLRQADKAKSWLLAIVRSCFLKACRRSSPMTGQELVVENLPERVTQNSDFDEERLQLAIDDLPEDFRIVVMMFYFEDLSYREIAEQLQIPTGTVMSRLSRAKGRLRHWLVSSQGEHGSISKESDGEPYLAFTAMHSDAQSGRMGQIRFQR
jgi:RNA polymerase sigma-70 factor (ECF subfamily)